MKRIIRKIINWAYGIDLMMLTIALNRQRNNLIMFDDLLSRFSNTGVAYTQLTWEDIQLIWQICDTVQDTERKNPDIMCSSRAFFSEVLKRFEDAKNKDHKK